MKRDDYEATVWRILRATYLRLIGDLTGRDLFVLSHPEQEQALDRWHAAMELDVKRLAETLAQARADGIARTHRRLHASDGVDHEMLDEAVEYAYGDES